MKIKMMPMVAALLMGLPLAAQAAEQQPTTAAGGDNGMKAKTESSTGAMQGRSESNGGMNRPGAAPTVKGEGSSTPAGPAGNTQR